MMLFQFITLVPVLQHIYGDKKVLLDTENTKDLPLSWSRNGECKGSWVFENNNYQTCVSPADKQNCKLVSGFYPILDANMIYVSVTLLISKCAALKNENPSLTDCNDFIKLSVYVGDTPTASQKLAYQYISDVPVNPNYTNPVPKFVTDITVVSIGDVTGKDKIQVELFASQFCGQLKKAEIFYYMCPASTAELVSFIEQPAPSRSKGSISISGKCSPHAVPTSNVQPEMSCSYDGTFKVAGYCICEAGYEKIDNVCKGDTPTPPQKLAYQYISDVPVNPNYTNPVPQFETNTTVVSIGDVTGKDKIQVEVLASQFCGQLKKVEIFYYVFPASTAELVSFTEQPAPSRSKGSISISGKCSPHAVSTSDTQPEMSCSYDGTFKVAGYCICEAGYEKIDTECKACSNQKFKPLKGNQRCDDCGKNSKALPDPKISCECETNFFKAVNEKNNSTADCYGPPGAPEYLSSTAVSSNHASLKWLPPDFVGDKHLGRYVVKCVNCPSSNTFEVTSDSLGVNITQLAAYTEYEVDVYNENEITNLTGKYLAARIKFKTLQGAPSNVRDVVFTTNSDGSVTFTWLQPFGFYGENLEYVIKYEKNTKRTRETTFTISTGTQDETYNVEIYAEVNVNGVVYRSESYTSSVRVKGVIPLGPAIGISIGVIIFIAVIMIAAFWFWRKQHPVYLQAVRLEDGTVKIPTTHFTQNKTIFVDPGTYENLDDAIQQFAFELDSNNLNMGQLLGCGQFAEVYEGELFKNGKKKLVAMKILKAAESQTDRNDFLSEAAILGQFNDVNVISLEGVVLKDEPNIIVLEYMCNGALNKYLQENDNQFTILQLLGMARGIASGMKYLSELGFIHRDLAARNILVGKNMICKVSDFGMSRALNVDETSDTEVGKIPVRWTAPEAIQYKKFTTSSDVWSYGVLLWEIVSYGERPYWNWKNREVFRKTQNGYRLPPPMDCPIVVHKLMIHCWNKDRTQRPKFVEIRDQLQKWIRNPDLLLKIASAEAIENPSPIHYLSN